MFSVFLSRPGVIRWLVIVLVWLGIHSAARAQLQMDLSFNRHAYILYEPIVVTVTITNNAGRDVVLQDSPGKPWLNMEVTTIDGAMLSPYDPDMPMQAVPIPAGQTVKRQIDISPLFPIRDLGEHRVRADLYFGEADKYFYSNYVTFDLTSGKTIWKETVGVPGNPGDLREVSLLTHRLPDRMLLYVRVREAGGNTVFVTRALGRLVVAGREPEEMLDRDNTLHVLQEAIPGAYLYTMVSVEGERLGQKAYDRLGPNRPKLVKNADGSVDVRGGQIQAAPAVGADGSPIREPKLSDRPAGLPTPPQTTDPYHPHR